MTFKIIDLFAGPGGLGEGFSAYKNSDGDSPFRIKLSIEKDESAHRTLQLRAFYRQFKDGEAPNSYYEYLSGLLGKNPEDALYKGTKYRKQVQNATEEAKQFTLGKDNTNINHAIREALGKCPGNWVLIGGPPCQAYSVAGRSKNRSLKGYTAEKDHRNYLYREYLKVISKFRPAIFVMENVKGMLSAKVDGESIFPTILKDLSCPSRSLSTNDSRITYELFSFVEREPEKFMFEDALEPSDFVIKSESYGIPQSRHRVILLGIRSDIAKNTGPSFLTLTPSPTVKDVICDLTPLRSGLSRERDDLSKWKDAILEDSMKILREVEKKGLSKVSEKMIKALKKIERTKIGRGSPWANNAQTCLSKKISKGLREWYSDPAGWKGICNHESRSHMTSDLQRYLFCAAYGLASGKKERRSPTADKFPKVLIPNHANWHSGHFEDRFRVQIADKFATTITSHIAKDGHYFIHYDPSQCRSLTVREAARIQTFPDNYFFVGHRTQQYTQVGNAVPPYLAKQIAGIIYKIIEKQN